MSPFLERRPRIPALRAGIAIEPSGHLQRSGSTAVANEEAEEDLAGLFGIWVVDDDAPAKARLLRDGGDELDLVVRGRVELQDRTRGVAQRGMERREETVEPVGRRGSGV